MTSPQPTPTNSASADDDVALSDALATVHAAIYCYGLVSAHSLPSNNLLVSDCLAQHRDCREQCIATLSKRGMTAPIAAAGYTVPFPVNTPDDATKLALQVESDSAVAWRSVAERATNGDDRAFAVHMLTECAVRTARWRGTSGSVPATVAFPGGTEPV